MDIRDHYSRTITAIMVPDQGYNRILTGNDEILTGNDGILTGNDKILMGNDGK